MTSLLQHEKLHLGAPAFFHPHYLSSARTMRILLVNLWIFNILNFSYGRVLQSDDYERAEDIEAKIESDPNLQIPEYNALRQCLHRKTKPMGRSPREASPNNLDEKIKAVMDEMERTMCRPREVCLEVSKNSTSNMYKPRCVSLHRCGGCCPTETLECTSTSFSYVQKTLLLTSFAQKFSFVTMTFVNHTACHCRHKTESYNHRARRDSRSILAPCSPPDIPCGPGHVWDPTECTCVSSDLSPKSAKPLDPLNAGLLSLCGPHKTLDIEQCSCRCRNGLTEESCGVDQHLDTDACQCVSRSVSMPVSKAHVTHNNGDRCSHISCPQGLHLNPHTCACRCKESQWSCLLKGKTFRPESCSCSHRTCQTQARKCSAGFSYSQSSCRCVADFARTRR